MWPGVTVYSQLKLKKQTAQAKQLVSLRGHLKLGAVKSQLLMQHNVQCRNSSKEVRAALSSDAEHRSKCCRRDVPNEALKRQTASCDLI